MRHSMTFNETFNEVMMEEKNFKLRTNPDKISCEEMGFFCFCKTKTVYIEIESDQK